MKLNRRFHTRDINTPELVDLLINSLAESGKTPEIEREELLIILEEAVTNAIEHGNKWDRNKMISIEAYIQKNFLHIKITDEGKGFPVSDVTGSEIAKDKYRPGGKGIFMIKKLCMPLWNRKGNQIDLRVRIK